VYLALRLDRKTLVNDLLITAETSLYKLSIAVPKYLNCPQLTAVNFSQNLFHFGEKDVLGIVHTMKYKILGLVTITIILIVNFLKIND